MIKQELYNILLKVSLYFFILFLLLFVVDLLFAVTNNAIDCTTGTLCSVRPGYSFYEITLMILGILIFVFMILARLFHHLVKKNDDLIDVRAYKAKYQQSQQAFSESELYQSTKVEKEDSIASILLKPLDYKDDPIHHAEEITIDDIDELPDLDDTFETKYGDVETVVVEDLMADELETYKKQKAKEKAKEHTETEVIDLEKDEITDDNDDDSDKEISVEELEEESALDMLAVKDIKERLYKEAITATEEEIKKKLSDLSKKDALEELRNEKLAEKEAEKIKRKNEKEEASKETKEEKQKEETPKEEKPTKKAKPKKKQSKSKKDLIENISEETALSKNKSEQFLNTLIDVITDAINDDQEVDFGDIGKFSFIIMPKKDAVNPQTKEKIVVPEHKEVRFRFDEDFKEDVNNEE